jgi:hypothetical protein
MQPFTAFLAAEHLSDLLREADEARRAALVRADARGESRPASTVGRLTAAARRVRPGLGSGAKPARA